MVSATYEQLIAIFWGCKGPVFKMYIPLLYRKLVDLILIYLDMIVIIVQLFVIRYLYLCNWTF